MKKLFILLCASFCLISCGEKKQPDPEAEARWQPGDATVAKHITSVHGFTIGGAEDAFLHVEKTETGKVNAHFRDEILKDLGGEQALTVFGWTANPMEISKAEYLYFLEALHAYLVLKAPKWDGGEGKT